MKYRWIMLDKSYGYFPLPQLISGAKWFLGHVHFWSDTLNFGHCFIRVVRNGRESLQRYFNTTNGG
jgi:hypothetical protein